MNYQIRIPQIRVFQDGECLGVMNTRDALLKAQEEGLDLVELVPHARPPVCHILDYGEYKYRESLKEKENRKKQRQKDEKELRFRPGIDDHDIETKMTQAKGFLKEGRKVRFVLKFKSREIAHKDRGFDVIKKLIEILSDVAVVESQPRMEGKSIICRVEPKKVEK